MSKIEKQWLTLNWTKEDGDKPTTAKIERFRLVAPALMAKGYTSETGIEIYAKSHFNGGGPTAFGGSREWPHLQVDVSFEEGQEAKRDELAKVLQLAIDKFFSSK